MQNELTDRFKEEGHLEQTGMEKGIANYRLVRIILVNETPTYIYPRDIPRNEELRLLAIKDVEQNRLNEWHHDHVKAWYPIQQTLADQVEWEETPEQKGA